MGRCALADQLLPALADRPSPALLSTWLGRILTLTLALPLTRFAVKLSKGQKPTEDNLRKYIAQAHRSKG